MILEFFIIFLIYMTVLPVVYYLTEVKGMPRWLNFKPFSCRKCLTFWSLISISVAVGLSFEMYYLMSTGIVMAILTAIAMEVHQKNNTIKIEETND